MKNDLKGQYTQSLLTVDSGDGDPSSNLLMAIPKAKPVSHDKEVT